MTTNPKLVLPKKAVFNPLQYPINSLWLSNYGISHTSGNIDSWAPLIKTNNEAMSSSGGNRPILSNTYWGDYPVITHSSAASQAFNMTGFGYASGSHSFLIPCKTNTNAGASQYYFDSSTGRIVIYADVTGGSNVMGFSDGAAIDGFMNPVDVPVILTCLLDSAGTGYVYINGVLVCSGSYTARAIGGTTHYFSTWSGFGTSVDGAQTGLMYYKGLWTSSQHLELINGFRELMNINYDNVCIFFGDSTVSSNPAEPNALSKKTKALHPQLDRYMYINNGVSGRTLNDLVTNITEPARFHNLAFGAPETVIINASINDIKNVGDTPATAFSDLRSVVQGLKAQKFNRIVVVAQQYVTGKLTEMAQYRDLIINNWSTLVSDGAWSFANLAGDSRLQDPTNTTYYNVDGIHLTATGNEVAASILYPATMRSVTP